MRRPPTSPLFPYTTLFRSVGDRPVEPGGADLPPEHVAAPPRDAARDGEPSRRGLVGEEDRRTEAAAGPVDLRLGKVQGVLALDVARAHVVAEGVAEHLAPG